MKFRTLTTDPKCIGQMLKMILTTASLQPRKRVIFRLSDNGVCLMTDPSLDRNGNIFSWCNLSKDSFFCQYTFKGISERHNLILFSAPASTLIGIIHSITLSSVVNLKLKLGSGANSDFVLHFNIENRTSDNKKLDIKHNIYISIIHARYWDSYERRNVNHQLSFVLAQPNKFSSAIPKMVPLATKVIISGKQQARDKAYMTMHFITNSLLVKCKYGNLELNNPSNTEVDEAAPKYKVCLNLQLLQKLFNAISNTNFEKVACSLADEAEICFHFYHQLANFEVSLLHYNM